ncbi:AMP-binding protein [Candidatus Electronema sp. JM]|uniref:AMP-binding protein n=1 Tax=Candidatus Electronema sp. JM TaxID=3401571 RepID=UPI003AA95C0C
MKILLNLLFALLLRLRYRIRVSGLREIKKSRRNDRRPILFLPNHQALIDPVIIMSLLHRSFAPRPLADENQTSHPLFRWLMEQLRAIRIPDLSTKGQEAREQVFAGIEEIIAALKRGDNVLLYPSGRISRGNLEVIGGNSGAANIVHAVPEARIVLVRLRGLWGSRFSRARGIPSLLGDIGKLMLAVLASGIFFLPRRHVELEFTEPDDFPARNAGKQVINRYLEDFYNRKPDRHTEVPLWWWQGYAPIYHDEAQPEFADKDTSKIPESTRILVTDKLRELAGIKDIQECDNLSADLGLDSIVLAEFGAWLQQEFGVAADNLEALKTVADCILAAGGIIPTLAGAELKPVSAGWFALVEERTLTMPEGANIAELFLNQAQKSPDQVILSDQIRGDKTWRQLIMGIFALLPQIERLSGQRVGIMLPGSVGAAVTWLAVVFSGKEPVMVNWTSGTANMQHSLGVVGATQVITAKALTSRLTGQGIALEQVSVTWCYLEDMAAEITVGQKIAALLKSRFSWRQLRQAKIAENAAILFTSGSEARPKAVPLTHANFLANLRDFAQVLSLSSNDRLLGILPVFHSLGLAGTVILPLCSGLRTVYWPNPTEGAMLARMTAAYGTTALIATPTFLQGMLRAAKPEQLQSLRLIFSGAEKCPEHVFAALKEKCPQTVLCEGYGVTECSPLISVNSLTAPQLGTIGKLLPSMRHVLLDPETGKSAAAGKNGRLLVRGPNVFGGYIGEAKSPFVEFDGQLWYDTGDLMFERDGVLVFAGRLKRFVKIGGEMISLPAIEQALETHYPIGEGPILAVAASGDEQHPELVLLTTLNTDRQEANQAIRAAGLSPLHNIRLVQQVAAIPLLGSGKTDYTAISRMAKEMLL